MTIKHLIEPAKTQYRRNNNEYHNWEHVEYVMEWLEAHGHNYDSYILAALYHDVIYDDLPNKEFRSVNFLHKTIFDERFKPSAETVGKASVMIASTTDHKFDNWPEYCHPLIKADLHQLGDPGKVVLNYGNIMRESIRLYSVSEYEFADKSIINLRLLSDTCKDNQLIDDDDVFWGNVQLGIETSIRISEEIMR